MCLTKEIIASWCLSKDTKLNEELILSYGFKKHAHVVENIPPALIINSHFDIYNIILAERENYILECRYAFYNGFIGIYETDKITKKSGLINESCGDAHIAHFFKKYLLHKAIKIRDDFIAGKKFQYRNHDNMFDSELRTISYY